MRHRRRDQRLSRPTEAREELLHGLVKSLVQSDRIRTTHARAKEAGRLADRLVTWGKDGSLHARRRAFAVLQDRTLVKRLFAEIAPRYVDVAGGYTRVVRLGVRRGDGAQQSLLAFSRIPEPEPAVASKTKAADATPATPTRARPEQPTKAEKPKGLLDRLRKLWSRREKGSVPF